MVELPVEIDTIDVQIAEMRALSVENRVGGSEGIAVHLRQTRPLYPLVPNQGLRLGECRIDDVLVGKGVEVIGAGIEWENSNLMVYLRIPVGETERGLR